MIPNTTHTVTLQTPWENPDDPSLPASSNAARLGELTGLPVVVQGSHGMISRCSQFWIKHFFGLILG